jgi:hypothetical protein
MSEQSAASGGAEQAEYVVVLRTRSSAMFLPEEGYELFMNVPDLDLKDRVRTFTRWVGEGDKELPREPPSCRGQVFPSCRLVPAGPPLPCPGGAPHLPNDLDKAGAGWLPLVRDGLHTAMVMVAGPSRSVGVHGAAPLAAGGDWIRVHGPEVLAAGGDLVCGRWPCWA